MQKPLTTHVVAKQLKRFLRQHNIPHFHQNDVVVIDHKNTQNFPPLHFRFSLKTAEIKIFHTLFNDDYTIEAHTITQLFIQLIKNELISPCILTRLL